MPFHSQPAWTRRQFLRVSLCSTVVLGGLVLLPPTVRGAKRLPIAEAFDAEMEGFMKPRRIPGGALAVVRHGRLVYARGYGWADREKQEPVKPTSLFRIASISKPLTSAAILKLVDSGRLSLDARVFDLLRYEPLKAGEAPEPRLRDITVRHCLQHTGGWDRGASGDPMFRSVQIAKAAGIPAPARQESIIRYMLSRPLDFAPGQRYAYSNFGYCLLGRVIEKLSNRPYEEHVLQEVLAPMRIRKMRLGRTLATERAAAEVHYYTPGERKGDSVFDAAPGPVPMPYGGFCLEAMDSHGGWLASARDLARFAASMDTLESRNWLGQPAHQSLYEPPAPPVSRTKDGGLADFFYAAGWQVRPIGKAGRANYWHNGSLPGTFTLLVRRFDGLSWVALFNQRSEDAKLPDGELDGALHRAADATAEWPEHDLFNDETT